MYFENNEIYNNIIVLILRYVNYRNLFQLYRDEMNRNLKKKLYTIIVLLILNLYQIIFHLHSLIHYYITIIFYI